MLCILLYPPYRHHQILYTYNPVPFIGKRIDTVNIFFSRWISRTRLIKSTIILKLFLFLFSHSSPIFNFRLYDGSLFIHHITMYISFLPLCYRIWGVCVFENRFTTPSLYRLVYNRTLYIYNYSTANYYVHMYTVYTGTGKIYKTEKNYT